MMMNTDSDIVVGIGRCLFLVLLNLTVIAGKLQTVVAITWVADIIESLTRNCEFLMEMDLSRVARLGINETVEE